MTSQQIRQTFLDFFASKQHKIVPSAPIVSKGDPTLLFTNAGMNQFKDFFLGHQTPSAPRIADTQKCLRVSGKHNDLEEVGRDGYHHTMFEMLGNWSFGDYFKQEAIDWAMELLVSLYDLPVDRLYATFFGGDPGEKLAVDDEARHLWKKHLPEERIIAGSKKDNFWEMGDTGPCGPCSEIHIDIRPEAERALQNGRELVNTGHPRVIEIWNLVFIQFNRRADGSLEELPAKHVDTGMGFERLCMAIQGKLSNYDTDVFTPIIDFIQKDTGITYTNQYEESAKSDIAMRVTADHIRAVSFAIADGQLPSNTGAGYVIRRILRRAVRYNFSFLKQEHPFLFKLVPILAEQFKGIFQELKGQEEFVRQVVFEEERSFLRTLAEGLKRLESLSQTQTIAGSEVFELYDTYGFPIDLTRLVAAERGLEVDEAGFQLALNAQRQRSRADSQKITGDWVVLTEEETRFVGYDQTEVLNAQIIKYRELTEKGAKKYQVVLDITPFYAEGGGQVGDTGKLQVGEETIEVLDTVKENDLIIHQVDRLPAEVDAAVTAIINSSRRRNTENNHSATHLLHAALRRVLGSHVQQKGSLVGPDYLRFDFSHFRKVSDEELVEIESIVNQRIRENFAKEEQRALPIEEAKKAGAMMLFGEKYGETVRMITFDPTYSRELCGGCHVSATGKIGFFKITHETAIAAGVRRIEAISGAGVEKYIYEQESLVSRLKNVLKTPNDPVQTVTQLLEHNRQLQQKVENLMLSRAMQIKQQLKIEAVTFNGFTYTGGVVDIDDSKVLKTLAFQLEGELENGVVALGAIVEGKPQIMVKIQENLVKSHNLNAGQLVKTAAQKIQGGGGGQPFFASAGGSNPDGLAEAIGTIRSLLQANVLST